MSDQSPKRIQLRRTKGWRKPEGAVVVARPSKWGNPFAIGERITPDSDLWPYLTTPVDRPELRRALTGLSSVALRSSEQVVDLFAWWLFEQPHLMVSLGELAGHDLGCWCKPGAPCHADVLLELANPSHPS